MKRKTRKQKVDANTRKPKSSKYARKLARRRKEAEKLGLPKNTPSPVMHNDCRCPLCRPDLSGRL